MTRIQYIERARQLCNLVNVRRIQRDVEPLQHQRIMRAVHKVLGPEPAIRDQVLFHRRPIRVRIWQEADGSLHAESTERGVVIVVET